MGHRLTKIYTRTGDNGTTGLGDGSRVSKDSLRIEACGTVDELNSLIGLVLAQRLPGGAPLPAAVSTCLMEVQHDLFDLGGELSIPGHTLLDPASVRRLEDSLDAFNAELPPLKDFILPGGNLAAAACHQARSVCRRAERVVIRLSHSEPLNAVAIQYLNRLSDLLFVIARRLARAAGGREILWNRER